MTIDPTLPFLSETINTLKMKKPVMSKEVERQVLNAIVQFREKAIWKSWGLSHLRKQGAAILLYGPPGCGKTVIAEYLSLALVKRGLKECTFADFGSKVPGENARQIRNLFQKAKDNKNQTIFMDECDTILIARDQLGADMQWMSEIINELLQQIGKYSGLVILATNRESVLDPALERRIIAKVHVDTPTLQDRCTLWKSKWPDTFPLSLTPSIVETLSRYILTGAEIENTILEAASEAIEQKRKPTLDDFCNVARKRATGHED